MTPDELAAMLAIDHESTHHDFKLEYLLKGPGADAVRDELAKDIVALANTGGGTDADYTYLILGAGDRPAAGGARGCMDVALRYLDLQLLDIVNARCYPPVSFHYQEIPLGGNTYGAVTIPPSPFLHWLARPIGPYKAGDYVRRLSSQVGLGDLMWKSLAEEKRAEWARTPRTIGIPALANVSIANAVAALLDAEARHASDDCLRRVDRPLSQMRAHRSYARWLHRDSEDERDDDEGRDPEAFERWEDVAIDLDQTRAVVVVGRPGQGKTIALLQAVASAAERARDAIGAGAPWQEAEPAVFVNAHELTTELERQPPLAFAIAALAMRRHRKTSPEVRDWLCTSLLAGRGLVAIDGLDEVEADPETKLERALFAHRRGPSPCRLLLGTREEGVERCRVLDPSHWQLQPFSKMQQEYAVLGWFGEEARAHRFLDRCRADPALAELLRNPLLCMLACRIWLPEEPATAWTRSELFKRTCVLLRQRWSDRVANTEQTRSQHRSAFVPFAARLAGHLWRAGPGRNRWDADEVGTAVVALCPETLADRSDLCRDLRQSGILATVGPDTGDAPHRFMHRMLLEYLVAVDLDEQRKAAGEFDPDRLRALASDARTHVVTWMLAGLLPDPRPVLAAVAAVGGAQQATGDVRAGAQMILDLLFEIRGKEVAAASTAPLWEALAQALERMQRRHRKYVWERVADPALVERVLREAAHGAGDEIAGPLLATLRLSSFNGMVPRSVDRKILTAAWSSRSPAVRWIARWAGVVSRASNEDALPTLLDADPSPAIRALACRALAEHSTRDETGRLVAAFEGACTFTAMGAAIGLGRVATEQAIDALFAAATRLLDTPADDPLAPTVFGSLENYVARTGGAPHRAALIGLFERALDAPVARVAASSASALGKLKHVAAWDRLEALASPARQPLADPMLRASATFALEQLAEVHDASHVLRAIALFTARLGDPTEPPEVRRPASSGLARLARRGLLNDAAFRAVLAGLVDPDEKLAWNCMRALAVGGDAVTRELVAAVVEPLDAARRVRLAVVIGRVPSLLGARIVAMMADETRAEVLSSLMGAASEILRADQWERAATERPSQKWVAPVVELALRASARGEPTLVVSALVLVRGLAWSKRSAPAIHRDVQRELRAAAARCLRHADPRVQHQALLTARELSVPIP